MMQMACSTTKRMKILVIGSRRIRRQEKRLFPAAGSTIGSSTALVIARPRPSLPARRVAAPGTAGKRLEALAVGSCPLLHELGIVLVDDRPADRNARGGDAIFAEVIQHHDGHIAFVIGARIDGRDHLPAE